MQRSRLGSRRYGRFGNLRHAKQIQDRAALGMITAAEESGQLHPGDTIVEGTAGNTGIGLAVIGHAKGYRTVIVIPETQSSEKINLLRTLGAEVITVPEKPYSDAENYNRVAQRLAQEKGWFWTNQFDNTANRLRRGCSSAFPPASTLLARCGVPDRPLSPCCAIPG